MAEKKTIELEVKSNLDESIAGLKALKRQLKDTAAGSEEFKKIYNQIDDLEDKIKSSKKSSSDWIDTLEQAGGPLGMVGASLNRAKVATQSFGGALKATGIGLFVSLIGGLVAAFQDNENAMKKLQPLLDGIGKIFNGVFRAVEPLFNTLVDLAVNALPMVSKAFAVVYSSVTAVFQSLGMLGGSIKKLISGDFSGAWQDAKNSVNDFGKNYDASIKRFIDGTKEITKVEKKEGKTRVQQKKETNDELDKLNQERLANDMQSAKDAMAILDEIAKAKETPAQKEYREYLEKKAVLEANNLDASELTNNFLRSQADTEYAIYEKNEKDKADKQIEFEQKKNEVIATSKQNLNNIMANLEASGLAKTKAGQILYKAIALTQIGIDTAVAMGKASTIANSEALAAGVAFPGVPLAPTIARYVSYASTTASVIGNLAKAKQLLSGGSGGGGGTSPSGGGGSGGSKSPSFNVVGTSATNQLAQTIGQKEQQPLKAYVVAGDITTAQSLEKNIIQAASIG